MKTKPEETSSDQIQTDAQFATKVSLSELRAIWNDEQNSYTDDELEKIREWLYVVANIVISVGKRMEKQKSNTQQLQINEHKIPQSYSLCESEYRRAS